MTRSPTRFSGLVLIAALWLAGCAAVEPAPLDVSKAESAAPLTLTPAAFSDLPGWGADDLRGWFVAYEKSCARLLKAPADKEFAAFAQAGTYGAWQDVCRRMQTVNRDDNAAIKTFIEGAFAPYAVAAGHDTQGLFTGYYEASLRGSLTRSATYNVPLYARPSDLVMVDLGQFRSESKGQRIAGRVTDGNLKPYESRAQIVAGQWPHNDQVLVWVDDAVDAFFVQIQGSGIVNLDNNETLRIGYAGQNGHVYTAIGKELIKRGALSKENVSMQAIRDWLAAHPDQADEIMNTNGSYVFFKVLEGVGENSGPIGGENIALTPQRSLAVDRSVLGYGLPLWVDIQAPRLQRLMVAQDTGGAIRGPVRGDVFWGYGPEAEAAAGPMKSPGRYWVLLPR